MSETTATILSAVIGGLLGGVFVLLGVWIGYYFSRRASEGDRHAELQYTIYRKVEELKNLLMAFKKQMITQDMKLTTACTRWCAKMRQRRNLTQPVPAMKAPRRAEDRGVVVETSFTIV
jgi:hypothetical protein